MHRMYLRMHAQIRMHAYLEYDMGYQKISDFNF